MGMKTSALMALVTGLAVFAGHASANDAGRIEKIRESGVFTIGYPKSSVPFAFLDDDQKPTGYTVELCEGVASYIKTKLKLEKMQIEYAVSTSSTRIPLLANGTIDLECGATTNLPDRHNFVDFAPTTFVAQIVLTAKKSSNVDVNDIQSFKGKTISAQAGGRNFQVVSELNTKLNLGMTILPANDTAQTFLMVQTGRADAVASEDALSYTSVATTPNPQEYKVGTKGLEMAPYGILEPKGDAPFKELVDAAVIDMMKSGRLEQLYTKYFTSPIPPKNINLNFPMSAALKKAISSPTSSGSPADYE